MDFTRVRRNESEEEREYRYFGRSSFVERVERRELQILPQKVREEDSRERLELSEEGSGGAA